MLPSVNGITVIPNASLFNFHLKPQGDVVLNLRRTVKVEEEWVKIDELFLIAASYWEHVFVPDGRGRWKSPSTNQALAETWRKGFIEDTIRVHILEDCIFMAQCESAVEDAADRQRSGQGPGRISCKVWPPGAQKAMDDANFVDALTSIRTQTDQVADSHSYEASTVLYMGTIDASSIETDETSNETS